METRAAQEMAAMSFSAAAQHEFGLEYYPLASMGINFRMCNVI
jgi:hypothetical protein